MSSVSFAFAAPQDGCSLPANLREELARQYSNAHVVSLADLAPDDKNLFEKEHGSACPGISKVDFYGDGKPTLAVVLCLDEKHGAKAQLIVAHEVQNGWELKALEQDITGPAPVVWHQRPGKYHDVYGEKTINAINLDPSLGHEAAGLVSFATRESGSPPLMSIRPIPTEPPIAPLTASFTV
jgi:hypothetical protein